MTMHASEGSGGWTVLVVDDEPQILRLLTRVFQRAGHRVLSAADGDTAVELLAAHAHELDALVLDVMLPPSGAEAVLDEGLATCPGLLLVLCSGDELDSDMQQRLAAHAGFFMRKPYVPREILRLVGEELARRRGEPVARN